MHRDGLVSESVAIDSLEEVDHDRSAQSDLRVRHGVGDLRRPLLPLGLAPPLQPTEKRLFG
jgi:hypothetical protein